MAFKLEHDDLKTSLEFWLSRYVKYKLNTLSNKFSEGVTELRQINQALEHAPTFAQIDEIAKSARRLGIIGINTYFNPLKKICEQLLCYELKNLSNIDETLLVEILSITTAGLSDASKKNYRIAVINFFKFIDENNLDKHLFKIQLKTWGGVSGASGVKLPEYMDEKQLKRFLDVLERFDFGKFSERNRLVVKIILFSGMRVSEALHLRAKDFSLVDNIFQIRIRAKGNKYRLVMIESGCIKDNLRNVLAELSDNDYLFFNPRTNKVLTQAYVSRIVEKILSAAGIRKEKNGAHMLRHSFATLLYKKEKDILLVQEALGHASLDTSRIYTHFDSDRLKVAAAVASRLNSAK